MPVRPSSIRSTSLSSDTTNSEVRELTKLTLRTSEPDDGASVPISPTRREMPEHLKLEPPDYEKELSRRLVSAGGAGIICECTAAGCAECRVRCGLAGAEC